MSDEDLFNIAEGKLNMMSVGLMAFYTELNDDFLLEIGLELKKKKFEQKQDFVLLCEDN